MGTEILVVSDHLLAAVTNGICQGILITVLVALSFRLFGRTNAATRHAVWLCTLVLLVLLVVAHVVFHKRSPALQPGRLAWTPATPEQEIDPLDAAAVPTANDGPLTEPLLSAPKWPGDLASEQEQAKPDSLSLTPTELPFVAQSLSVRSMPLPDAALRAGEPNNLAVEPLASTTTHAQSSWFRNATRRLANPVSLTLGFESRAARIAGAILLCGCLSLSGARLFMLLLRLHQIRKLKLQSFPASAAVNEFFQGLVTRLGVGRKVELKTTATSQSSFVLGFLHPVILVPAEPMEPAAAEQILRHELAHVRRRDDWANLLQHFILAAFPFHPAVCWISRRLSLEREIACDDYVLQSSGRPHAYALLLANLAGRMQRCPPLLAPGASNNKTQLQQRIDMILNTRRNTSPRLAATWLTIMASAAVLFAITALCLAPRIVLAQSEAAPAAANAQAALVEDPVAPAVASVAVSFSPEPGAAVSSPVALPASPRIAANASGPKLKPGYALEIPGQPAVEPAPPTPTVLVAPALPAAPVPLTAQPAPPRLSGSFVLSASPVPEPRPGRMPRSARAESADSAIEERLERLEKMVESLLAHGYATQNPKNLKQYGQIDRKELPEIEARRHVEMALKHELDAREIERIKEHAKRESARAVEQAKRAAANVERAEKEQKRQIKRDFKEGSRKQLDELHKRLESLEREREKLEHQIEELERQQEQQDEQRDEEHDSEEQSHTSECNQDTKPSPRF